MATSLLLQSPEGWQQEAHSWAASATAKHHDWAASLALSCSLLPEERPQAAIRMGELLEQRSGGKTKHIVIKEVDNWGV